LEGVGRGHKSNWHKEGTGKASTQHAELAVLRESQRWISDGHAGPTKYADIFTDSKYVYNASTYRN